MKILGLLKNILSLKICEIFSLNSCEIGQFEKIFILEKTTIQYVHTVSR